MTAHDRTRLTDQVALKKTALSGLFLLNPPLRVDEIAAAMGGFNFIFLQKIFHQKLVFDFTGSESETISSFK